MEQLSNIQQTAETLRAHLVRARADYVQAMAPIGAFPFEIIQYMISFVVESPEDRDQIITLCHISRIWRAAVLGMSRLFVSPNWERWSDEALEKWCSWAGTQSLKGQVWFGWPIVDGAQLTVQLTLDRLVERMLPFTRRLGSLNIIVGGLIGDAVAQTVSTLFSTPMPSLRRLAVQAARKGLNENFIIPAQNVPLLDSIILNGFYPIVEGHFNQLQKLRWHIIGELEYRMLLRFLKQNSSIKSLVITFVGPNWLGRETPPLPLFFLPSLTIIQVEGSSNKESICMGRFFRTIAMPNLRSLRLINVNRSFYAGVLPSIVCLNLP